MGSMNRPHGVYPKRAARAAGGLALGALLLAGAGRDGPPAHAIEPRAAAQELVALSNLSRTSNGLRALLRDNGLTVVALARSEDMVARDYFSHQIPPSNTTVVDQLESIGVPFRNAGENIAWNNAADFFTVQSASEDFMNSPSHRKNLLDARWERIGAGVAQQGDKKMYTVLFLEVKPKAVPAGPAAAPTGGNTDRASGASFAGRDAGSPAPAPTPAPAGTDAAPTGQVEVAPVRTGLIDNLVNRLLRLFLNY